MGDYGSTHAPHSKADAERRAWKAAESRYGPVVHQCPDESKAVMPCCGRTPFEVPRWHRITMDAALVTCGRTSGDATPTDDRSIVAEDARPRRRSS